MTNEKGQQFYTIRKIKSINEKGEIDGKILYEDYILEGKLIKEEYKDEKGNMQKNEYRQHIYPVPGKEIIISGKKYNVHSLDIPEDPNKNKIINVN